MNTTDTYKLIEIREQLYSTLKVLESANCSINIVSDYNSKVVMVINAKPKSNVPAEVWAADYLKQVRGELMQKISEISSKLLEL